MSSEIIAHHVYKNILKYLERVLGIDKMKTVAQHLNRIFPTWEEAWRTIYGWLREHPLTNMQNSIHSFAQLFPSYPSFSEDLNNSLVLDDAFWNQVYFQLRLAKSKLEENAEDG